MGTTQGSKGTSRNENNLEITKNYFEARLFIALYIGDIRIIDNFKLY